MKTTDFTKVNHDTNGNPRYVCHFLHFLKTTDSFVDGFNIDAKYRLALKRAKKIGGKKFHNKQYGGGIVFQSYNLDSTVEAINTLLSK
ncbi:MAG: hypothetical protein WCH21_12635 [Bacteroidota bacterium]